MLFPFYAGWMTACYSIPILSRMDDGFLVLLPSGAEWMISTVIVSFLFFFFLYYSILLPSPIVLGVWASSTCRWQTPNNWVSGLISDLLCQEGVLSRRALRGSYPISVKQLPYAICHFLSCYQLSIHYLLSAIHFKLACIRSKGRSKTDWNPQRSHSPTTSCMILAAGKTSQMSYLRY